MSPRPFNWQTDAPELFSGDDPATRRARRPSPAVELDAFLTWLTAETLWRLPARPPDR